MIKVTHNELHVYAAKRSEAPTSLYEHPGYLGFTSQGVIAIHANWPAYPAEHGWAVALDSLGSFPEGALLTPIDDIDRCVLFVAPGRRKYRDPFDERALHVAIWHEDLLELAERELVEGVEPLTEREFEARRREEHRESIRRHFEEQGSTIPPEVDPLTLLRYESKGEWHQMPFPPLEEYDDDEWPDWVGFTQLGGIRVTQQGWEALEALLGEALTIPDSARPRIQPLLDLQLYDTAIREMAVLLESRLRGITRSELYGIQLVDAFIRQLLDSGQYISAQVKVLRGSLRTAFIFVRNEFAHNATTITKARCLALLSRLSGLLQAVESFAPVADDGLEDKSEDQHTY